MAEISDHLAEEAVTIWLDLRDPDRADLAVLSDEFGLHPLAIEDAVHEHQRPKLDRYRSHLFLTAYGARLNAADSGTSTRQQAARPVHQNPASPAPAARQGQGTAPRAQLRRRQDHQTGPHAQSQARTDRLNGKLRPWRHSWMLSPGMTSTPRWLLPMSGSR